MKGTRYPLVSFSGREIFDLGITCVCTHMTKNKMKEIELCVYCFNQGRKNRTSFNFLLGKDPSVKKKWLEREEFLK
jgi:hypothetical protein